MLGPSDLYADEHHWGDTPIDLDGRDLPALKARFLVEALPARGRVLEIGCGGGRLLNTIAASRPDLELCGCDIRALAYEPVAFRFSQVTPRDQTLPYEPGCFDAVVLFDVLEHALDPAGMLRAARRVTRPGGIAVSFTPLEGQPFSFYRLYRRLLGDRLYVETKEHVQAFSEQDIRQLVGDAGFAMRDVRYVYHWFGHLMDATLFALLKWPRLRHRFWDANPYYAETHGDRPVPAGAPDSGSALGTLLRAANRLAYEESRLLARSRVGAAGLLFTAAASPEASGRTSAR